MKTDLKEMENDKSKLNLSKCLIYDAFIKKNNLEYYVGQIHFNKVDDYWTMNFKISNIDMNLIKKEFLLKLEDKGFFSTVGTFENNNSIQIHIENKLMDYFIKSNSPRLERNYNFH
jgi:hypothetical protein